MKTGTQKKIIYPLLSLVILGAGAIVIHKVYRKYHSIDPLEAYIEEVKSLPENDKPRYDQNFLEPTDNPRMPRVLKPNHTQLFDGSCVKLPVTEIRINSHGFRGQEYTVQKSPGSFRILGLGDSFTFGWGLNQEETYLTVFEKRLNHRYGRTIEVLNFGLPGGCTTSQVELFRTNVIRFSPDLILLAFNNKDDNDLEVETRIRNELREEGTDYIVPEGGMERVEAGAYLMRRYMATVDFDENWTKNVEGPLGELTRYVSEKGIDLVIFSLSSEARKNDRLRDFCGSSEQCFFLKTSLYLEGNKQYHLHPLDDHPNAEANRLMAEELFAFFVEKNLIEGDER